MSTATNLEQEKGLPLECQIKTQSEYQLGQAITVTGVIHNAGASAVYISPRNTFLEPNGRDYLSITHNGSPVDYAGIGSTQMFPDAKESYLQIPAGESVEGQIDLSENYAITEAGDYEASFDLRIVGAFDYGDAEPALLPHRLQLTIITSNKATFRIEGGAATQPNRAVKPVSLPAPEPLDSLPGVPKRPILVNIFDDEAKDIFWAHQTAYQNIRGALKSVKNSIDTQLYDEWFDRKSILGRKAGWEERQKTVISNLTKMATWMATATIQYIKTTDGCGGDTLAWTDGNLRNPINLCPRSFNVPLMYLAFWTEMKWVQTFILIHEISHAAAGTTDYMYPWGICRELSVSHPEETVKNAQNYSLFAMGQLDEPKFSPLNELDLKTGDKITLKANNGNFLSRIGQYGGNYIRATKAESDQYCIFTVTVTDDKKLHLQADDNWYWSWNDNGGYIMTNKDRPDENCYFTPGEFADVNGNTYLVLMAVNGQILSVVDPGSYMMATKTQLDPWCLFKVIKPW